MGAVVCDAPPVMGNVWRAGSRTEAMAYFLRYSFPQDTLLQTKRHWRSCVHAFSFFSSVEIWWRDGVRDEEPKSDEDDGFDAGGLGLGEEKGVGR